MRKKSVLYNTRLVHHYSFTLKQNMIKLFLFVVTLFSFSTITAQKHSPEIEAQFKSLKWLEGTWHRTNIKAGMKANEAWHNDNPYELKGLGITLKGSDTVFMEKIRILIREGNIYYVADVKENKEPVYFKFTTLTPNGFVCENPQHDFPKKIEYKLTDSNLTVIISAGDKSRNYLFARQ